MDMAFKTCWDVRREALYRQHETSNTACQVKEHLLVSASKLEGSPGVSVVLALLPDVQLKVSSDVSFLP
jgi:hypothetical protein